MRESYIEKKLCEMVAKRGGICEKWTAGKSGWPDRIILLPDGKVGFVELKAPGKKPRPLQAHRHNQLRQLGMIFHVIDDVMQIGGVLDDIQTS